MSAAPHPPQQESLIAGRDLRVAVGDGVNGSSRIVEVRAGEPWPADALGRVDVLIRTGHVLRFDEDGIPDKRSWRYCRRLGIARPEKAQVRSFHQRARALALRATIAGREVRIYPGRPDGDLAFYRVAGRAYALRQGCPDDPAAVEALRGASGGVDVEPRRRSSKVATTRKKTSGDRRRRRKT